MAIFHSVTVKAAAVAFATEPNKFELQPVKQPLQGSECN